jgi:hypothetical protein
MEHYLGCKSGLRTISVEEADPNQVLIMYFVSYGTSHIDSNASFRLPWGLQMIPALGLLCCLPFMPRSPRWLASKDRWEEALSTLAILRSGGDTDNAEVLAEMQEVRERVQYV